MEDSRVPEPAPKQVSTGGATLLHAINEATALIQNRVSSQRISELLFIIVEQATHLLRGSGGAFYRADPQAQVVRCEVSFQGIQEYLGVTLRYGEGLAGKVAQSGEALIIDDYRVWAGRAEVFENDRRFRAVICVPVNWKAQAIGALQVLREESDRPFTADDLELLTLFANQAAVAIENARLFDAERRRIEELEAVRQASLGLASSLELNTVLKSILRSTMNLLPDANFSEVFLYVPQSEPALLFGASIAADGKVGSPLTPPQPEGLTAQVAQSGESQVVSDFQGDAHFADLLQVGGRAIIGIPLKIGERVVGVMNIVFSQPRVFSDADLHILRLLADHAAVAVENARLYAAAATERQHLSLLYDITRGISSSLDVNEILERAAALTRQALQGLNALAYLYVPEEDRLIVRAVAGPHESPIEDIDARLKLRPGKGLAGWVASHRQAVCIADVEQDPRWWPAPEVDFSSRSAICSPIQFGDELLGVLIVLHAQPGYFTTEHLSLLETICQGIGVALSNARRHEETQRRLAEITLIQSLTQAFSQRLEVQQLLDEAACQLVERLSYAAVSIHLVSGKQLEQRSFCNRSGVVVSSSKEVLEMVAQTGEPALVRGGEEDTGARRHTYLELAVPIFLGKSVVGVISIFSDRQNQISRDDSKIIQVLAGQISVGLENAMLYEQLRRQTQDLEATVARRTVEMTEFYDLSQEIGFLTSFPDLLQRLLRRLRKALRCDITAVCLKVDGEAYFYLETRRALADSLHAEVRARCLRLCDIEDTAGSVSGPLVRSEDFNPQLAPLASLASTLQAPLQAGQRMLGVLFAGDEQSAIFSQEHVRLVTTFANQASTAAERLANLLSEQQQQWGSLVEYLPVGVLLLDAEFRLLTINPLGSELVKALNGAAPPASGALTALGSYSLKALAERPDSLAPVEIAQEGPAARTISAVLRPVRAQAGTTRHPWVLMLSDITVEKENLKRLQSQDRLATVGQLAAGIAHDFNNIMATILVYADLLRFDASISDSSQEKLAVIRAQIQRASSLIRQILDFSRRSVIEHVTLDLLPLLKEFDKMLKRLLPETITLELKYQPGAFWVSGDPTRLQQALMNLAVNARDAMPSGGRLRFEMSAVPALPAHLHAADEKPAAGWIRIIVADTGCGIPPDIMEHLFEPFYTTKPPGQGTGLGLAQVYGIITQHGGAIDVSTQAGEGATITIYLPAIQIQRKETGPLTMPNIFDGDGRTVLIAEDDAATREAIYTLLEASQCHVIAAKNGVEALEKFRNAGQRVDAVISDIVMPEMGGISLYRAIQAIRPGIKILMITGHPLDETNQQILEQGNIRWLQKPFSISDFSRALMGLFQA